MTAAVAGQPPDGLRAEEGAGVDTADEDAGPGPVLRSSRPMVTRTVALGRSADGVTRVGVGVGSRARRQTWTRASPRRWSMVRGSRSPSTTAGLRQDVDGGFDDGAGFGVEPQPVLGDPAADVVPTRQDGQAAVPVLDLLQPHRRGRTGPASPAGPGGPRRLPSTSPIATRPAATASTAPGSSSGVSCRSSDATTQLADTDSRPSCTATRAPANADVCARTPTGR